MVKNAHPITEDKDLQVSRNSQKNDTKWMTNSLLQLSCKAMSQHWQKTVILQKVFVIGCLKMKSQLKCWTTCQKFTEWFLDKKEMLWNVSANCWIFVFKCSVVNADTAMVISFSNWQDSAQHKTFICPNSHCNSNPNRFQMTTDESWSAVHDTMLSLIMMIKRGDCGSPSLTAASTIQVILTCVPMKKCDTEHSLKVLLANFQWIAESLTVCFCVQNVWNHTAAASVGTKTLFLVIVRHAIRGCCSGLRFCEILIVLSVVYYAIVCGTSPSLLIVLRFLYYY